MSKVLVLYYSSYGHIAKMADAVAEGARAAGAEVDVRRVRETAPEEVAKSAGFQVADHHAELTDPNELTKYDAIIVGTGTRYGRMSSQMAAFWDTTGGIWAKGGLVGKIGGAFTSTASQHGGQETTLFSIITNLMHHGLTIVGLDYGYEGHLGLDEVNGSTPYGASTIAAGDGSRQPTEVELGGARYQGKRIAELATKVFG
ncbi:MULTISPECIES: NAD(P)H:quinone oxidoreductase [unclassified Sphingomonas]|uniref:NAD(P)H:quinone oxidoreductase n=1 Tax=unclassified Sphingomonas TaxID=196159 RepID=UPI0006FFA40B|nr:MULTISPECIES: NAD(P)H:quinone oxidoreductase [unclassified Sphingomonas]KQM28663.1 NAD(P)H:quinone oxidoreductase [Sphingomonas sp. Leaf9]KQM45366.1 NAD(P)H:quinone oxidoreductase [Sphingomonas sp. Leaf11]